MYQFFLAFSSPPLLAPRGPQPAYFRISMIACGAKSLERFPQQSSVLRFFLRSPLLAVFFSHGYLGRDCRGRSSFSISGDDLPSSVRPFNLVHCAQSQCFSSPCPDNIFFLFFFLRVVYFLAQPPECVYLKTLNFAESRFYSAVFGLSLPLVAAISLESLSRFPLLRHLPPSPCELPCAGKLLLRQSSACLPRPPAEISAFPLIEKHLFPFLPFKALRRIVIAASSFERSGLS